MHINTDVVPLKPQWKNTSFADPVQAQIEINIIRTSAS
jgi:hypothetical protein